MILAAEDGTQSKNYLLQAKNNKKHIDKYSTQFNFLTNHLKKHLRQRPPDNIERLLALIRIIQ